MDAMTVIFEAKHLALTTFLKAEFGFLGVRVKTRKQIAFLWGDFSSAGFLILCHFLRLALLEFLINWFIVAIVLWKSESFTVAAEKNWKRWSIEVRAKTLLHEGANFQQICRGAI